MTAPKSVKVSMPWHEWDRLVNAPLIAVSRDDTLPLLTHVLVRRRPDGRLVSQGTDRYRLVTVRTGKDVKVPRSFPDLLLPYRFIERVNRAAKTTARDRADMTITLTARTDLIEVTAESALVEVSVRHVVASFDPAPKTFPPLDRIIAKPLSADPQPVEVSFNPHYLADVKRISDVIHGRGRYSAPTLVKLGPQNEPALFRIGVDCLYLLVPLRFGTDTDLGDPWDLDLPDEATA